MQQNAEVKRDPTTDTMQQLNMRQQRILQQKIIEKEIAKNKKTTSTCSKLPGNIQQNAN